MRIEAILAAARCPRVYTHTRSPIAFLWNEFAAAQLYSSCLHIWHYVIACFSCFRPITKYSFQFTLSTKKYVISHTSIRLMWCCASAKWIAPNVITASQPIACGSEHSIPLFNTPNTKCNARWNPRKRDERGARRECAELFVGETAIMGMHQRTLYNFVAGILCIVLFRNCGISVVTTVCVNARRMVSRTL